MEAIRQPGDLAPGVSGRTRRLVLWLARPVEHFLHVEASSGILLLGSAAIALTWANSPWAESYEHLLHAPIVLGFDEWTFSESLHFWINDILMVLFFFVVGLEIRREMYNGALSSVRGAALPVAAALGGMLLPAAFYLALNGGTTAHSGWGVPMATDIAFAVGILALLGDRATASLRVLLLAVAIIDDIGAILVIAVFYSTGVQAIGFGVAAVGAALVLALQRIGVRNPFAYVPAGIVMWAGMLQSGVHPTIAGVALGLWTPVQAWYGPRAVTEIEHALEALRDKAVMETDARKLLPELERINIAQREAVAPLTRIEAALHPWVAYGVMPLFALANAGVALGDVNFAASGSTLVIVGICLGLVVGKPLGIVGFSALAIRMGVASLPAGVTPSALAVLGCVAGIGFTMALFIGSLAFPDPEQLAIAKVGVLAASAAAGVAGIVLGRQLLPRPQPSPAR